MSIFTNTLFTIGEIKFSLINFIFLGLILFSAFILNKIAKKYLNRWLKSHEINPFDKLLATNKDDWKKAIIRLTRQIIFIMAFMLAIQSFSVNNEVSKVSSILEFELISLPNFHLAFYHVFLVIAVFFCAKILINLVKVFVDKRLTKNGQVDKGTKFVIIQLAKYVIYILAITICVRSFVHNMTLLLTSSAALLVGIGLGLQDLFKDVIAGFVLLFENTVKVGDVVEVKSKEGLNRDIAKVLRINLRTIKIETRDGNVLIIPNNKFTQDVIRNWSFGETLSRFHIPVNVHYKSDVELAKKLIIQAARSHPDVSKTDNILVRMNNFGANGLELELIFWAKKSWEIEMVTSDIRFEMDRLFRENSVNVPYPQLTINRANKEF
jgi:small-conductance mechanosensitive channel